MRPEDVFDPQASREAESRGIQDNCAGGTQSSPDQRPENHITLFDSFLFLPIKSYSFTVPPLILFHSSSPYGT
jgi:hypothetical protein